MSYDHGNKMKCDVRRHVLPFAKTVRKAVLADGTLPC